MGSTPSRSPFQLVTALWSAIVALEISLRAATIAAPSARTVEAKSARGRMLNRILIQLEDIFFRIEVESVRLRRCLNRSGMVFDGGTDPKTYGYYDPLFIRQAVGDFSKIVVISQSTPPLIRGAYQVV